MFTFKKHDRRDVDGQTASGIRLAKQKACDESAVAWLEKDDECRKGWTKTWRETEE